MLFSFPPHPHTLSRPVPIVVVMKMIAANNLHILILLVTNVLQINNILHHFMFSVYINTKLSTSRNMSCDVPVLFSENELFPYVFYRAYYRQKL